MQKFFVEKKQIDEENKIITILGEDVNHIKNVLRCIEGEHIEICEKSDIPKKYVCEILSLNSEEITCKIVERLESSNEAKIKLHIFQGLPKAEKMELIIQKCTELGAYEFVPVEMKRCVVKLNSKDEAKKIARWQKIAEVASKQCGRDIIPKVTNKISIKELGNLIQDYDMVLVAYENEHINFLKNVLRTEKTKNRIINIALIIGPEGGFDDSEIKMFKEANVNIVSLGNRILRTETAPIVLSSIIMYELGDIGG